MIDDFSALVEKLYAASLEPESVTELIDEWERQVDRSSEKIDVALGLLSEGALRGHLNRATQISERFEAAKGDEFDQLVAKFHTAAMVVALPDRVVAANASATEIFNVKVQQQLEDWLGDGDAHVSLLGTIDAIATATEPKDCMLRFRVIGSDRLVMMHLRPVQNAEQVPHVLVVTSEYLWGEGMTETLQNTFGVTLAEIKILRHLAAGDRVSSIAAATGRSEGTVRTQLNALMQKTGIRSQNDLLRLAALLCQSTRENSLPANANQRSMTEENIFQRITLRDGRRLDYMTIGDPAGQPLLWLMSHIGLARWHYEAERTLGEMGLRMIVPVRAGYGYSAQPPHDRAILDVAVDDTFQLINQLKIERVPVIAPCETMRIAFMMAQQQPRRISHIFAAGASFPIAKHEQHRRLHVISRFFRANARYAPIALSYVIKVVRTFIRQQGVPAFIRQSLSNSPIDQAIFADPAISAAIVAGFQLMIGPDTHCERAFSAEILNVHAAWPKELGDVDCPVTLFHGAQDHNAAIETVREYAWLHPQWELLVYPEEGQLILYSQWREILSRVEKAVACAIA